MILVLFIIFIGLFALFILAPYFSAEFRGIALEDGSRERDDLENRKAEVLEAINDLEFDFRMKKMTQEDYQGLKEKLTQQAVDLMKKMDELEGVAHPNAVRFKPKAKARS